MSKAIEPEQKDRSAQKRWATILHADLENFTSLTESSGEETIFSLVNEIFKDATQTIVQNEGVLIETAGDSMTAAFGAPIAVENASLKACRAALAIQANIRRHQKSYIERFGIDPKIRIGLASGLVVAGDSASASSRDINMVGEPIGLATKIQDVTEPGQVFVAETVFEDVREQAAMEATEPRKLDGLPKGAKIYRLDAIKSDVSEFSARHSRGANLFVSRQREIDAIKDWMSFAPKAPFLMDVHGSAGIGKSRLVHEALKHLPHGVKALVANCNKDIMAKPFAAITDILRQDSGWLVSADRKFINAWVERYVSANNPLGAIISELIDSGDISGANVDHKTAVDLNKCLQNILADLSASSEKIIIFEDVHWIDQASAAIISDVLNSSDAGAKIISTRRTEVPLPWAGLNNIRVVELSGLSQEGIGDLVADMLGVVSAPSSLIDFVAKNSEGNSLFAEETIRFLIQTGQVRSNANDVIYDPSDGTHTPIGNLQHLILAKFDRLGEDEKSVLRMASLRGRRISENFLSRCFQAQIDISAAMQSALGEGLIEPDPEHQDGRWQFAHALFSNAISQSLLETDRAPLHATIAQVLEGDNAPDTDENSEALAYHYELAGNLQKAVYHLWKSAEKAFSVYSVLKADEHLQTAFNFIEQDPSLVGDRAYGEMLSLWIRTLDIYGDFYKLNSVVDRFVDRVRKSDFVDLQCHCLSIYAHSQSIAGDYEGAVSTIAEVDALPTDDLDDITALWRHAVKFAVFGQGNYWTLAELQALFDEIGDQIWASNNSHLITHVWYFFSGLYRAHGQLVDSERLIDELVEYGQKHGDARALNFGYQGKSLISWFREEFELTIKYCDLCQEKSIRGTSSWRVSDHIRLIAQDELRLKDVSPDTYRLASEVAAQMGNTPQKSGAAIRYFLSLFKHGKIHEGWNKLQVWEGYVDQTGTQEARQYRPLFRAMIYLAVSGLEPETSGGEKPKLGLLDIMMAIRLRIGAIKNAERYLNEFIDKSPNKAGVFYGLVVCRLGIIRQKQKDFDAARDHYNRAIEIFDAELASRRADQVRKMLATLPS